VTYSYTVGPVEITLVSATGLSPNSYYEQPILLSETLHFDGITWGSGIFTRSVPSMEFYPTVTVVQTDSQGNIADWLIDGVNAATGNGITSLSSVNNLGQFYGSAPEGILPGGVLFQDYVRQTAFSPCDNHVCYQNNNGFGYNVWTVSGTPDPVVSSVPEPASIALMGLGMMGVLAIRRKSI
jgi:hypothetical protein